RELGVGPGPVLVYAGATGGWHMTAKSIEVAGRVLGAAPNGPFLVLTPDPAAFEALALQAGLSKERLRVRSAAHSEMPRFLAAGDVALLLREEDTVNKYA